MNKYFCNHENESLSFIANRIYKSKIIFVLCSVLLYFTPVNVYAEDDILVRNDEILVGDDDILLVSSESVLDNDDILFGDIADEYYEEKIDSPGTNVFNKTKNSAQTVVESKATTSTSITYGEGIVGRIIVHRISNLCDVYNTDNQLMRTFVVSTGRKGHNTPLGTYRIYEHNTAGGYHLMVDGTYGRWCMRFKQGGYMFHSVCYYRSGDLEPIPQEVLDLGTSVSRGCVRLSVQDAEWLYKNTSNGCLVNILND